MFVCTPPPPPLGCSFLELLPSIPAGVLADSAVGIVQAIYYVSWPVFALKQVISVIQLSTAVRRILALDEAARDKAAK